MAIYSVHPTHEKRHSPFSPLLPFLVVLSAIVIVEITIMLGMTFFNIENKIAESVLDALILVLVMYPVITRFLFAPLVAHVVEQEKNKDVLRKSRERLAAIFALSPQPMMLLSADEVRYVDVNRAFESATGYARENVIGKLAADVGIVSDPDRIQMVGTVCRDGKFEGMEVPYATREGELRYGLVSGSLVTEDGGALIMLLVADITDRKKTADAVKKSEEEYRTLMEVAAEAIFITDLSGRFLDVNGSGCSLLGYPRSVMLSMSIMDVIRPEQIQRIEEALEKLREGQMVYGEWGARPSDGRLLPMELSLAPFLGDRLVGIARDISDTKAMEEQLVKAKDAAIAYARTKSAFLAAMSHEIRTPMNGVIGMLELALTTAEDKERMNYMRHARHSADVMLDIINEVLDFSKIEAGRIQLEEVPFLICNVLDRTLYPLQVKAREKKIDLTVRIDAAVPLVAQGDPGKFSQIVGNLAGNAVKFTEKGHVAITVGIEDQNDASVLLQVVVEDTGIGIPQERCGTIFDPFTQVDGSMTRRYGGTGLGLSIARSLTEAMGGGIRLDSEEGKGSRFTCTMRLRHHAGKLPEADAPPLAPPQVFTRYQIQAAEPLRILLVEDSVINQLAMTAILQQEGHQPVLVTDGRQAVETLKDQDFDLVFMDIQMPELDGISATRLIREAERATGRHVPIFAFTAHAFPEDRERCLEAGMDGFLAKPVSLVDVKAVLAKFGQENNNLTAIYPTTPVSAVSMPATNVTAVGDSNVESPHGSSVTFATEAERLLDILEQAVKEEREEDVEQAAAILKSLAEAHGAILMAEDIFRLQLAVRKGDQRKPVILFQRLREEVNQLLETVVSDI